MAHLIFRFAEALRSLLRSPTIEAFEERWHDSQLSELGWTALQRAWQRDEQYGEVALDEVDGLLLRLLDRLPRLAAEDTALAHRLRTFRLSELERMQHAAAAALVAQRFGVAGLRTVLEDDDAPLARRYFSFFSLAERHPPRQWPVFARYLSGRGHHAFVGAAAETARFYPWEDSTSRLTKLFEQTRGDLHWRTFLSPRILESLYVLDDPASLPFFRGLLTSGYTDSEPAFCEVTVSLVMVRRFTGEIEPSVKFADPGSDAVRIYLEEAERTFNARRNTLHPVTVI